MAACHPLCESARKTFAKFVLRQHTQLPITGKVVLLFISGGTPYPGRGHLVLGPHVRGMASPRTMHLGGQLVLPHRTPLPPPPNAHTAHHTYAFSFMLKLSLFPFLHFHTK